MYVQMSTPSHPWERLRQERERLGLSQAAFAAHGGVKKWAQIKYEKGARKPDSKYLAGVAAAGADVAYILTGQPAALRDALHQVKVATSSAAMLGGTRQEIAEHQERIFEALRAQGRDESELLADYRNCNPPDKQVIRQMASRLAAPNSDGQPKGRTTKKKP